MKRNCKIANILIFLIVGTSILNCSSIYCIKIKDEKSISGYYLSNICYDCAGFSIGSLTSDLALNNDSSFILRDIAIRYSFRDTTVIMEVKGNWTKQDNKLILNAKQIKKTKVDSIYNKLSEQSVEFKGKGKIIFKIKALKDNDQKCEQKCGDIFRPINIKD
jgi:hypothetical protein